MTEQISCPNCSHEFCRKCLAETWKRPIGTFVKWRYRAEEELFCCSCSTPNIASNWPVRKIPKPKDQSHLRQMDFFDKLILIIPTVLVLMFAVGMPLVP